MTPDRLTALADQLRWVAAYLQNVGWPGQANDVREAAAILRSYAALPLLDPPQAPAEGVERDAARYRWLRENHNLDDFGVTFLPGDDELASLDAAIDAQISTTPKGT